MGSSPNGMAPHLHCGFFAGSNPVGSTILKKPKRFKPGDIVYDTLEPEYIGMVVEQCAITYEKTSSVVYHTWSPTQPPESLDIRCFCGETTDFQWSNEIETFDVPPNNRPVRRI